MRSGTWSVFDKHWFLVLSERQKTEDLTQEKRKKEEK